MWKTYMQWMKVAAHLRIKAQSELLVVEAQKYSINKEGLTVKT